MVYEAIEPAARNVIFVYIPLMIFAWVMTSLLYLRWKERQKTPTKLMLYTFLAYAVAISGLVIGYLEMYITGEKREIYKFSLAFGYFMIMIANMVLIYFAVEIFQIPKENAYKYWIGSALIAIAVVLPNNYYGVPEQDIGEYNIRIYTSLALVFFSMLTYARISILALNISKKTPDLIAKAGFKWIAYSQFCFIFYFLFLLIDTIYFTITGSGGYTIFVYFAWIMAGLFYIFSYFGLIMPPWIKKRYSNQTNSSNSQ